MAFYGREWYWDSPFPCERFPNREANTRARLLHDYDRFERYPDGAPMPKYRRTSDYDHPLSSPAEALSVQDFAEENHILRRENAELKRKIWDFETTDNVLTANSREMEARSRNQLQEMKQLIVTNSAVNKRKVKQLEKNMVTLEKYNRLKLKCQDYEKKHAQLTTKPTGVAICSATQTPEKSAENVECQTLEQLVAEKSTQIEPEIAWGSDSEKTLGEMQGLALQRDEQLMQLQQNNASLMQELDILKEQIRAKEELLKDRKPRIIENA